MSGNNPLESGQESGSELRQKLEATLAENATLRTVAAAQVAQRFEHVKPEDLTGVSVDELDTKAKEISEVRAQEQQQVLSAGLKNLGWTDDQIQQALASQTAPAPSQPASQLESIGKIGGEIHRELPDTSNMSPAQKIAAGIASSKK